MKKTIILIMIIGTFFSLVACSNNKTAKFSETVVADTDEYKITITDADFSEGVSLEVRVDYRPGYDEYPFYAYLEGAYINGIYCEPNWYEEISNESYDIHSVRLGDELLLNGIEKFTEIKVEFEVYYYNEDVTIEESVYIYPYGEENATIFLREPQPTDEIILENDFATITVVDYFSSYFENDNVNMHIINNGESKLYIEAEIVAVNGVEVYCDFYPTIPIGSNSFSTFYWWPEDYDNEAFNNIDNIQFFLTLRYLINGVLEPVYQSERITLYPNGYSDGLANDSFIPISDDINSVLDSWVYNGEISGYILGENRHIVYKNIEASFDEYGYQIFGVVDDSGNYIHEMKKAEDYGEIGVYYASNDSHKYGEFGELLSNSTTCSFRCNDYTLHLGNNLFADLITDSGSFSMYTRVYNANDNSYSVIDCGMHNECWTAGNTAFTAFLDGFNDGGFIATNQHEYTERVYGGIDRVLMIYDTGDVVLADIVRDFSIGAGKTTSLLIGDYSDGLFWAYGNFYDANGNLVIDFSEKDYGVSNSIDDVPYFENGECRLNVSKSGEKWEIYIDKEGNMLYDPVKITQE